MHIKTCKKVGKIILCAIIGAGILGFIKGLVFGYFIGKAHTLKKQG